MSDLRKVSFYLNPAQNAADKVACGLLDTLPVKARGRASRAALLAGMALMKQDPRLPGLLAEILDERTTIAQIRHLLCSVLPDGEGIPEATGRAADTPYEGAHDTMVRSKLQQSAISENADNTDITRENARHLFPG